MIYDCDDADQRAEGIRQAAYAVRRGDLVVLPTDTVYGIGADAFTPAAVAALLAAKGRGRDMPVPVLVGSRQVLDALVESLPDYARALIDVLWPGALTVVARHTPALAWDLGDSHGTVAVRMPADRIALDLLKDTGPMAVSSANRSGLPPATTCANAQAQLGDSVAVYLDGGPTTTSVPSTIVDVTGDAPVLLRRGWITEERLREIIPDVELSSPAT
jgi:tRNA threonylcarbamoyl adenosine modification protein (Sua5/YciO/YrdC/YwlC family)